MRLELIERQWETGDIVLAKEMWDQLQALARSIGLPEWAVDLVLVSDNKMTQLNHDFRGKDSVTDILSFTYLLADGAGAPACGTGQHFAPQNLWTAVEPGLEGAEQTVGELVLAPHFIQGRCLENDWDWSAEIPMLVVHGCLHLLGWDHAEPEALMAMQNVEIEILAGKGLTHPLRQRS